MRTPSERRNWGIGLTGVAGFLDGGLQLRELHLAKGQQDVILAGKVVKKGAFADVRRFGDIFHRRLGKAFSGKEIQCRAKQAFAGFSGAAFAAAVGRCGRESARALEVCRLVFS